ncbi:response regulator [Streptosporangium sp. NPDC048865]|uniref:response regulator transcription factor n=1 Tax=Streptosporangium sp. NPDC048865 TaxID=3155766 RepID=UPI003417DD5C
MPPERLLIVDDDPTFRAVARDLLDGERFAVVGEAASGSGGLDAIRRLSPDVVLLDVQLPDVSGFDVCPAMADSGAAVVLTSIRDASSYGSLVGLSGARGFVLKDHLSVAALSAVLGEGGPGG